MTPTSPTPTPWRAVDPLERLRALLRVGAIQRERVANGDKPERKFKLTKRYADGRQKASRSHLSTRRKFKPPQPSRAAKSRAKKARRR